MTKRKNYVNNKDLTEAIVAYQKSCRKCARNGLPEPIMRKYIGECISSICNRLTQGFNFSFGGYSYHDEMVSDAIERCIYAVRKYNHKKSTSGAFSYLTTVAINAKKKRLKDEKKQNYIKHKYTQSMYDIGDPRFEGQKPNEMSDKVISDFEGREERKLLTKQSKPYRMAALRRRK